MVVLKNRSSRCHFCTKVFCCSECRDAHENNKHPEFNSSKPKCLLCFKYDLPFDPRLHSIEDNFERAQLVCHVVINHLPLRCKICGDKFETSEAFQNAQPCKGPAKKLQAALALPAVASTPSICLPCNGDNNNNSENIIATPAECKLPLTPQYHIEVSGGGAINKTLNSAGSLNLKNPENFDSPPELARHTSTPMHLSVVSLQKNQIHPASIPEFNLKTPSSQRTFDNTGSTWGSAASGIESRYYTADVDGRMLRLSLEATSNSTNNRENQETPNWSSPVFSIAKKQLERQNSGDDSPTTGGSYRVERSILKSALLSRIDDSSHRDSIEKRVRFSDQFIPPVSTMADNSVCDNDIFFEARESLDDDEREVKEEDSSKAVKEVEEKKVECVADSSSVGESKINVSTASTSSLSSRVVMMLLVEKTDDSKGFSSLDLAPLIDSGLKKLEESAASINDSKAEGAVNRSTGTISKATTEITSYTRQIDGSLTETSRGCRRRASIKDTFVTRSDRIECITPPRRRSQDVTSDDQERELSNKADSLIGVAGPHKSSDSLFSTVARVVRSAFKKLPAAVTARNLSREPIPPNPYSSPAIVTVSSPAVVVDSQSATSALAVVRRSSSIKRPRERIDSHDELATLRDSSGSISSVGNASSIQTTSSNNDNNSTSNNSSSINNNSTVNHELVVKSPAAKRHRGWYRIRAREPIARMRERQLVPASPRGASRETQRFQQGALSIGDTFLPLPSRAHQSTQTED